jgi:hypothetical protein
MRTRSLLCLTFAAALFVTVLTSVRASSRRHSVNVSGGHRQPTADCFDLHIQFDDQDAVVRSEVRTVSKAEAAVLKVRPHTNGGTQVVGWDGGDYSVTACRAVAPGSGAEGMLSQITMSIENGVVSTHGPADEDGWTVYLLIRAPRSAVIELETKNGPISVYDLDGRLTAHAQNGPISLRNFSGKANVNAVNGPISLEGSRGNISLRTVNGPINVNVKGTSWKGAGLSADAENGPVTLAVPSGYQSGFLLETSNHTPMSCRASICENARKTWDDEHRRIEYGSSAAVLRLSTVNGPVSVRDSREREEM